ncbi:MAG: hypothetical protein ACI8SJ_001415 [Shewanella sp.]|jgi:hypothetical protein
MQVKSKSFEGSPSYSKTNEDDELVKQAEKFASSLGPENLINISVAGITRRGGYGYRDQLLVIRVTVFYWQS